MHFCTFPLVFFFLVYPIGSLVQGNLNTFIDLQCQKIFEIFHGCTIHFSHLGIQTNLSLAPVVVDNIPPDFISYCPSQSKSHYKCTNVHTTFLQEQTFSETELFIPEDRNPERELRLKPNSEDLLKWELSGYENWDPIKSILAFQKGSRVCLIQLKLPSFLEGHGNILNTRMSWWRTHLGYNHLYPNVQPILITNQLESNSFPVIAPAHAPWKLIIVKLTCQNQIQEVYFGCGTCGYQFGLQTEGLPPAWFIKPRTLYPCNRISCALETLALIPLPLKTTDLALDINSWWKGFSLDKNLINGPPEAMSNSKPSRGLIWSKHQGISTTLSRLIRQEFNCSKGSKYCRVNFLRTSMYFSTVIPQGVEIATLRYCVIGETQDRKVAGHQNSISALLKPFKLETWLIFLSAFSLYLIIYFLKETFSLRWLLWLYATTFEQGDNFNWWKNRKWSGYLFLLVSCWLFQVFLLRNYYTSTMYSEITKEPAPNYLPSGVLDLFDKSAAEEIKLVVGHKSLETSFTIEDEYRKHAGLPQLNSTAPSGFRILKGVMESWAIQWEQPFPEMVKHSQSRFHSLLANGTVKTVQAFKRKFGKRVWVDFGGAFALFFDTDISVYDTPDAFFCPLIGLFSGRTLYENSEQVLPTDRRGFKSDSQSFLTEFVGRVLKHWVESGVVGKVKKEMERERLVSNVKELLKYGYKPNGRNISERTINPFTFADLLVTGKRASDDKGNADVMLGQHRERRISLDLDGESEAQFWATKLEEMSVIWQLLVGMLLVSFCTWVGENGVWNVKWMTKVLVRRPDTLKPNRQV